MKRIIFVLMIILFSGFAYAMGLDDDVVLMLHADGDESDSAHTFTANGNPEMVTLKNVFNQNGYFDGDGDYLTIPDSTDWDFGTGDFTIDMWVYPTSTDVSFLCQTNTDLSQRWCLWQSSAGSVQFFENDDGTNHISYSAIADLLNSWHHIAVIRNGDVFTTYVDGTSIASQTVSRTMSDRNSNLVIGRRTTNADTWTSYMKGYIDELRISKGIARWTSNFTPDTSPYSSDSDTKLLLHMDGTPGSQTFTDSGNTEHTVTANNDVEIRDLSRKFDSAIYFEGNDYLTIPDSTDWDIFSSSSDNWTIDFWVKHNVYDTSQTYLLQYDTSGDTKMWFVNKNPSGAISLRVYDSSSYIIDTGYGGSISDTDWHHVAVCKAGGDYGVYLDGTQVAYDNSASTVNADADLEIGRHYGGGGYLEGSMDELRIINSNVFDASPNSGITDTISSPTSPYAKDSNTKLLLHFDGDVSDSEHNVEFNGNSSVDSSEKKWNSSFYFDGDGDYLTIPDSDDWDFGSDDFTVDFWVNLDDWDGSDYQTFVNYVQDGTNTKAWEFGTYLTGQSKFRFIESSTGDPNLIVDHIFTDGTWHHLAVVRDGNTFSMYLDGGLADSTTSSNTLTLSAANLLKIGRQVEQDRYVDGFMDELRISKDARWTSNFTVPSSPYNRLPVYSEFSSAGTTDLSSANLSSVTNLTLATSNGKINFSPSYGVYAESQDYNTNVEIGSKFVSVNTSALDSSFNNTATITMENVDCPVDIIFYADGTFASSDEVIAVGKDCESDGVCSNIQCSGTTLTFDVSHFTGFAAGANANLTTWADAGTYYENESVPFYASYINATDGTPLPGGCNISFDDNWGTWYEMDYNGSQYNYSRSFLAGLHDYNVTCSNGTGYSSLEANDSKYITPISPDVPEFSLLTLGLGLAVILAGLYVLRKK
mgnify:CR=1 FL=1